MNNPLAFIFDSVVSGENISLDYNLFDNDTRYHVITSKTGKFVGVFSDEDNAGAYRVEDVLGELTSKLPELTTISIVDGNGQVVDGSKYIENGMKLVVNILGEILEYDFLVYGDVDGGYVENSDLSVLIDKVFNESATTEKEFLNTITHYVLKQSYIDKIYKGDIFKDHNYLEFNYR